MIIEDGTGPGLQAANGRSWRCVSDRVMGGLSEGNLTRREINGRPALHLTGDVRLDNDGGFLQMALDLAPPGAVLDASGYAGLALVVRGNDTSHNIHLRGPDLGAPWQSWRATFRASTQWRRVLVPFAAFIPYRTDLPLAHARLGRIGLVAIGHAMAVDLALARLELVADPVARPPRDPRDQGA